ncbi:alpha/beta hydrolase [Pseudomonas massiliensis]|uniref:alpha/beta hydrolase n=1 Tax=Pseudomonas massiliensis TaxID=522492 RepID=UPI00058E8448|nr:alpha/beta fold hydrolase [Pseudomonas massiliensis]
MLRLFLLLSLCLASLAQAAAPATVPAAAQAPAPASILQRPISLDTGSGILQGSLLLPRSNHPVPVALIISGSGATDRDGNNPDAGRTDSLKKLAWALARAGIASVRYDKRGVASGLPLAPDERQLSVEAYVADAVAWTRKLAADPRFGPLTLIGHSEGALIASLAAPQTSATGVVALAGSGRPIDQVLREQLRERLPPALYARSEQLLDELKAGQQDEQVPQPLQVVFRPSVQPYLISLFRQNPAQAFAALLVPALVVQGEHDIQVGVEDADALVAANSRARKVLIPGMNHVLRIVPLDMKQQVASYNNPNLPLAAGLADALARFIKGNEP